MSDLNLIVKCTRLCNLSCRYCSHKREGKRSLGSENLGQLMETALSSRESGRTHFLWHGGEPLIMGKEYFRHILALQRSRSRENQVITNSIQTNGTLIDDEWAVFFRENNFTVGVSLDGPESVHDRNRRYRNGNGSFEHVVRGTKHLRTNNIPYGCIAVASADLIGYGAHNFFEFLVRNDIRSIGILAERPPRKQFPGIGAAKKFFRFQARFATFMCELYDILLEADDPRFEIRELNEIMEVLLGGRPKTCAHSPCVGKMFGVDRAGTIAHCDKFFDDRRFVYGQLGETNFDEITESETFRKSKEIETSIRDKCQACTWFEICNGGCLFDAVLFENSGLNDRVKFCPRRKLYEHVSASLQEHIPEIFSLRSFPRREERIIESLPSPKTTSPQNQGAAF